MGINSSTFQHHQQFLYFLSLQVCVSGQFACSTVSYSLFKKYKIHTYLSFVPSFNTEGILNFLLKDYLKRYNTLDGVRLMAKIFNSEKLKSCLRNVWTTTYKLYIWKFVEHLKSCVMEMKISWRNFIANFNLGFPQQEKGWNETIWPSLCWNKTLSRAYRQWCTMGLPGNWMSWWIVWEIGKEKLCLPMECLIPPWYHSFLKHLCFNSE